MLCSERDVWGNSQVYDKKSQMEDPPHFHRHRCHRHSHARFFAARGTSAFFSAFQQSLHAATLAYFVTATVSGVFFHGLLLSSGNIFVPIVAHAVYDAIALVRYHVKVRQAIRTQRTLVFRVSFMCLLVVVVTAHALSPPPHRYDVRGTVFVPIQATVTVVVPLLVRL